MFDGLIKRIDFKWWSSLEAQQKLTIGMFWIIIAGSMASVSIIGFLYRQMEMNRVDCRNRIEKEKLWLESKVREAEARGDACYEGQMLYIKENVRMLQEIFYEERRLEQKSKDAEGN